MYECITSSSSLYDEALLVGVKIVSYRRRLNAQPVNDERSISEEIESKLVHCILYDKELLAMQWVIPLIWLQLTQTVIDDTLCTVGVVFH